MVLELAPQQSGQSMPQMRGSRRIGELLLELGYITHAQLAEAIAYQQGYGGRLGWILTTLGYLPRLKLFEAIALHFRLPFLKDTSYLRTNADTKVVSMVNHEEVTRYQVLPFRITENSLTVLTTEPDNPDSMEFLRSRFGPCTIKQIVVTDIDFMKASEYFYRDKISDASINGLFFRNSDESARRMLSATHIILLSLLLAISGVWIYFSADTFLISLLVLVQIFYLSSVWFKFIVTLSGINRSYRQETMRSDVDLDPKKLPVYTVLIAAYKEANVVGTLIKAINRLDYPKDKLDVILLLEEDDIETLEAAKKERPPASWRILTLPNTKPKTKPKALNYGLYFARGDYLTIYDAEDIPEPDQLKKAVAAFRTHSDDYICFQAALNYFNKNENFLTKMFTLEYSYWFDCLLPGLDSLKLPIPLGGTSNHFDVKKLKQIGGWDPFNVTEDADLGIRASSEGYKVGVIDSTTYEEANSKLGNWLKQRSRWVKGYMQTFIVHNRHPIKSLKAMGLKQWFGYNLLIGGTPALFLLNPIMWALFLYYLISGAPILDPLSTQGILLYLSAINLFIGNILVFWINTIGIFPRRQYWLLPYTLLIPVYWMLQSFAAYKALWQLITRPSYWEKTAHGITAVVVVI